MSRVRRNPANDSPRSSACGAAPGQRLSWPAVLRLWIFSVALTLACGCLGWMVWQQILVHRSEDGAYQLAALIQTGPEVEVLPTAYLEELLGLSQDHPVNLYQVPLGALESRLLQSPCIAKASVSRVPPKSLRICYEARQPIAVCSDLKNALIDGEGILLPYQPYFRPRRLPSLFVGILPQIPLDSTIWGKRIPPALAAQARQILGHRCWQRIDLLEVDLSHGLDAHPPSREIVLQCRVPQSSHHLWVRIASSRWEEALARLETMIEQPNLLHEVQVVDLRMMNMAILTPRVARVGTDA